MKHMTNASAPRSLSRTLGAWLPEIALILVSTAAGLWAAGRWLDPFDDPAFPWSVVYRLSHGERLYRDIYVQYTPLSFYLLAWGARVFGASARYFLLSNWIPAIVAALLLLQCGRRFLSELERLALAGLVLASSLLVPGFGHLVLPYNPGAVHALAYSMGAFLLLPLAPGRALTRALLAGGLAGLAFGSKQEIGLAALVALLGAALAGLRGPVVWTLGVLAGFFLALLPIAVFIFSSAPLSSLQKDSFLWPLGAPPSTMKYLVARSMGVTEPHWLAAVATTASRELLKLGLLAIAAMLLARDRKRAAWARVVALLIVAGVGSFLLRSRPLPALSLSTSVAFAVAILALLLTDTPQRPSLFAFATFAGLASLRAAFSPQIGSHYAGPAHFATALTSLLFLTVFVPSVLLSGGRSAAYLRRTIAVLLLAVCSWQTAIAAWKLRDPSHLAFETREGTVFSQAEKVEMLEAIARHSSPGERVLAFPENHALDVLFHLHSLSPLTNAVPGFLTLDIERQVIRRSEASPPELVVVFRRTFNELRSAPFGEGFGRELAAWFSRDYRVVESLHAGKILRRRDEPPSVPRAGIDLDARQ